MNGNQPEQGVWEDRAAQEQRPGFELSDQAKNILLMLFVFSIILFFMQYNKVYGSPSKP